MADVTASGVDMQAHIDAGRRHVHRGHFIEAATSFRAALQIDSGSAALWHDYGTALKKIGENDAAFASFKNALHIDPARAESYLNLGNLLIDAGQLDDAVSCFEHAAACDPQLAQARTRLAEQQSNRGQPVQAEKLFRQAIGLAPDQVRGWFGLGRTLEDLGDAEGALGCYRQVLAQSPDHVAAHAQMLGLIRGEAAGVLLANAERLLHDERLPHEATALIGYGLAKYRDRRGDYRGAAAAGMRGNAARRHDAGALDRAALSARVDGLIATCDAEFFRQRKRFGVGADQPVFIVGLPRSGTTLTEQILAAHPRLFGAGELPALQRIAAMALPDRDTPLWQSALRLQETQSRALALDYLRALRNGAPASRLRISDKSPLNLFQLGFAALLFPNARVIYCRRDGRDNALSIWMENFAATQQYATDFDDLAFFTAQVDRLMQHWREHLSLPMLELHYEETVADVDSQARRLIDFLGVDWDERCLDFYRHERAVQTPSRWQVRQPVYSRSVGRWRAYRDYLPALSTGIFN